MELHEKKTTLYKEQKPEKVESYLEEIKDILPEKIAYVDESGIDQYLAPLFEHWFKQWLLPCLPENAVIVMDNASFHRKGELFRIAAQHHRKLIFLPPDSPELNPIEHFWAKLKQWLKNTSENLTHLTMPSHCSFPLYK